MYNNPMTFKENKKPFNIIISCICALVDFSCLLVSIVRTIVTEGSASRYYGLLCIAGLLSALCGFVFGISAWKKEEAGVLLTRVMVVFNFIVLLLFIGILLLGVM